MFFAKFLSGLIILTVVGSVLAVIVALSIKLCRKILKDRSKNVAENS